MTKSTQIVQARFRVLISWAEYEQLCLGVAAHIAAVPGLVWKAWVKNEARSEAGGVYLFDTEEAATAFLAGPIVAQLRNHPAFAEVQIQKFSIAEAPSAITGFPLRFDAATPGLIWGLADCRRDAASCTKPIPS